MRKYIGALLASSLLTGPPAAADSLPDATWAEIRAFLEATPALTGQLLQIMGSAPDTSRDAAFVAANPDIAEDARTPILGNPEGTITLVKFNDYGCPHCRNAGRDVARLIETFPELRVVVREMPVLGPASMERARLAGAIFHLGGQDAYEAVKLDLFSTPDASPEVIARLAGFAGLDADAVALAMASDTVTGVIERTLDIASNLGITGTPAFILGDEVIRGRPPFEAMRDLLQGALAP